MFAGRKGSASCPGKTEWEVTAREMSKKSINHLPKQLSDEKKGIWKYFNGKHRFGEDFQVEKGIHPWFREHKADAGRKKRTHRKERGESKGGNSRGKLRSQAAEKLGTVQRVKMAKKEGKYRDSTNLNKRQGWTAEGKVISFTVNTGRTSTPKMPMTEKVKGIVTPWRKRVYYRPRDVQGPGGLFF